MFVFFTKATFVVFGYFFRVLSFGCSVWVVCTVQVMHSIWGEGTTLSISDTFKYLGITFEAGRKLKVSLTSKKIKFF